MTKSTITYTRTEAKIDPAYQASVNALSNIDAVHSFFVLDNAGKVVVHSSANAAIGELITYCIVACTNLRKAIEAKALRRIHMQMKDGTSLLILPLAGKIVGMVLDVDSSVDEVINKIQSDLTVK
ncbi:MAG: hypothetical protein KAR45_13525 [Desulfobacteraceae bacterium]|nr:hypothetical protein [Desulfobacteraceae bacterium]